MLFKRTTKNIRTKIEVQRWEKILETLNKGHTNVILPSKIDFKKSAAMGRTNYYIKVNYSIHKI